MVAIFEENARISTWLRLRHSEFQYISLLPHLLIDVKRRMLPPSLKVGKSSSWVPTMVMVKVDLWLAGNTIWPGILEKLDGDDRLNHAFAGDLPNKTKQ